MTDSDSITAENILRFSERIVEGKNSETLAKFHCDYLSTDELFFYTLIYVGLSDGKTKQVMKG